MEIAKVELAAVEKAIAQSPVEIKELVDLELVMVGGGTGDVSFG